MSEKNKGAAVEQPEKKEPLFEVIKINEVISAVHQSERYYITAGQNIISKKEFKDVQTLRKYVNSKPWELMANLMFVFIQMYNNKK